MNCAKIISMNIGDNCSPIVKGYKPEAVIININDIDFDAIQYDEMNSHVVKSLTLLNGKVGFKVMQQGAQPFNGTNSAMSQGTYQNDVTNTVSVVMPRDAETTNRVAQPLANGAVVVMVLESKSKGADGNSAFEIIGLDGGLVATASTSDVSGDAGKNYVFTLTETTSNLAMFLNAGSYNSTKLLVEGLIKQS
jgi:hypothetical protein